MMKTITISYKSNAEAFISKMDNANAVCYYLNDDYEHFIDLRNRFGDGKIKGLAGLFDKTHNEIMESLLALLAELNKKHDYLEWWGGQIASRSTSATPLFHNIVYLFCAKKILSCPARDIVFIVNSYALSCCIADTVRKRGYNVIVQKEGIAGWIRKARQQFFNATLIICFFWQAFRNRRVAAKLINPLKNKKTKAQKRVVIRSWITKGTVDSSGELRDRNFGILPEWLRSKNFEVFTLPMFFNLGEPIHVLYSTIKNNDQLLIPDHYLEWPDYMKVVYDAYNLSRKRIQNAEIGETDISPLLNEIIRERAISSYGLLLNLCYPLLKRLKEEGIEIDSFIYAFENNSPEKQFILACRKFFPASKIIGFQHTTFFPNQLAYHLGPGEKKYYPLPDKIVCSGPIYMKLYEEAGFPPEIFLSGPNLRFGAVHIKRTVDREKSSSKRMLLLPLTFSYELAFDLFSKVKKALKDSRDYEVYIRNHPLLSKNILIKFLRKIGMNGVEFADEGTIQDWLMRSYAVISTGSITILESVIAGVPVIRVIPDNTFFYDPFAGSNYPLKPVNTAGEIAQQLHQIGELKTDSNIFSGIAKQTLSEYFTEPNEENMQVFL